MNFDKFESVIKKVESHLFKERITGKTFYLPNEDITFAIEFSRDRTLNGIVVRFCLYNELVSTLASETFGRDVNYAITIEHPYRPAENGKTVIFTLYDFSTSQRNEFYAAISSQAKAIFMENKSLSEYISKEKSLIDTNSYKNFELPEVYFKLAMTSFAAGYDDWEQYIEKALTSKSEPFKITVEKLRRCILNKASDPIKTRLNSAT